MVKFSRSELLDLFFQEVKEYLPEMENGLSAVVASRDMDAVGELHRLFHNVKGAAAQVQLSHVSAGSRVVEDYLDAIVEGQAPLLDDGVASIKKSVELLTVFVDSESTDPEVEKKFCQAIEAMEWPLGDGDGAASAGNLETIRSLLPLLGELAACLEDDATHRDQNKGVYKRLASSFATLTHLTRSSKFKIQTLLFEEFNDLLTTLSVGGNPHQDEVAGLVKDFLGFVEVAFSGSLKDRSENLEKIHKQLGQVKLMLLSGDAEEAEPLKVEPESEVGEDPFLDGEDLEDSLSFLDELDEVELPPEPIAQEEEASEGEAPMDFFTDQSFETLDFASNELDDFGEIAEVGDFFEAFDTDEESAEAEEPEVEEQPELKTVSLADPEEDVLAEIFRAECEEHFITINASLNNLEKQVVADGSDRARINPPLGEIRRAVHTLKGAASMTGVAVLAGAAHTLEDMLDWLYDYEQPVDGDDIRLISESVESLERLASDQDSGRAAELQENIESYLARRKERVEAVVQAEEVASEQDDIVIKESQEVSPQSPTTVLPEESGTLRVRLDDLDELLSVEGELVVARGAIEKMMDEFSGTLTDLENVKENLRRKSQELETGFEVQALYGGQSSTGASAAPLMLVNDQGGQDLTEFDPIELDRYSELNLIIRSLNEISVDVNSIYSTLLSLSSDIGGQVAKQQLTMRQMQDKLMRIRMTPLSSISRVLYSTVRSASAKLGKDIDFTIIGEDVYMDRFVWAKATDPLVHILRNAVDHGIEDGETRRGANKSERGTITLRAEQRSRYVVLHIEDDGGGIDPDRLREKIIAAGLVENADTLSDREVLEYIFYPSISTKEDVSELSGRGVGLDVVRKNIQDLRGSVHLHNKPGQGLRFEIHIPFTLSVNRAVLVDVGGSHFAIPLQDVEEIRQYRPDDLTLNGEQPTLTVQEEQLPFSSLASYVQLEDPVKEGGGVAILFNASTKSGETTRRLALSVSGIVEQREIIVKSLGSHLTRVRGVGGVTVSGSGELIPILNLRELVEISQPVAQIETAVETKKVKQEVLKVLIVDDSISVRFSVARLVESCGWIQQQAVDGLDALAKLESYTPDVIILDIEMPKMNGYEFKSNINNREQYRDIPVVMLTSRQSEKHQQKARELGVDYYLTKPYEDESFIGLLEKIEQERM